MTQAECRGEQRAHSEFCMSGLCWCVMITVGPGQQDVCRWGLALLRSSMCLTLLNCASIHLCAPTGAGDRKCVLWQLLIHLWSNCSLWQWSFRSQAFEVSLLHSIVQQGIGSLTIPFLFQLFCACSSYKKTPNIGTLFPPCQPEANIVTRCDQCPLKTEKVSPGNIQVTGQVRITA